MYCSSVYSVRVYKNVQRQNHYSSMEVVYDNTIIYSNNVHVHVHMYIPLNLSLYYITCVEMGTGGGCLGRLPL